MDVDSLRLQRDDDEESNTAMLKIDEEDDEDLDSEDSDDDRKSRMSMNSLKRFASRSSLISAYGRARENLTVSKLETYCST